MPSDDFSLIALICVFTHSLENEKSRQLHGGGEVRSEPGRRRRSGGSATRNLLTVCSPVNINGGSNRGRVESWGP